MPSSADDAPLAPPDLAGAAEHLAAALEALGFPPDTEMARTPDLVAGFLASQRPLPIPEVQPLPTESSDLVVVRDMPFHSLCAHHLLPFFGHCTLAYRPAGRIAGLGWFPRLLDSLSRRPQLQERLGAQLADAVVASLEPTAVAIQLHARQLCVEMRGARSPATFEVRVRRGAEDAALDAALR